MARLIGVSGRLDHPVDHPDDRTGPVWIRLDQRGLRPEQARSVWSRPDRRRAPGYGSGVGGSNPSRRAPPAQVSGLGKRFGKLAARLGHDYTLHGLRHFTATQLAAVASAATVRERMAHGSLQVTSIYTHRVSEADRAAAQYLGQLDWGVADPPRQHHLTGGTQGDHVRALAVQVHPDVHHDRACVLSLAQRRTLRHALTIFGRRLLNVCVRFSEAEVESGVRSTSADTLSDQPLSEWPAGREADRTLAQRTAAVGLTDRGSLSELAPMANRPLRLADDAGFGPRRSEAKPHWYSSRTCFRVVTGLR
jgi:hypothetical protein